MQVRLHHHREQRLVDPPAPLQQRGEERPGPQLGKPQLQIPSRRGQHAGPVAVALGQPVRRALVGSGADHGGELGLDEGLVDGLGGLADAVIDSAAFSASRTSISADWSRATVRCVLSRAPLAWSR
jgi:hypothetical protein